MINMLYFILIVIIRMNGEIFEVFLLKFEVTLEYVRNYYDVVMFLKVLVNGVRYEMNISGLFKKKGKI